MTHKNPLAFHKSYDEKARAFQAAVSAATTATDDSGHTHPLGTLNIDDVEFISGAWRVQNKFPHKIQEVRGEEFVLTEKLNRTEKNLFDFYRARMVGLNCYGRFIVGGPEVIVAKYDTDRDTYWSYGPTLEQARAFLGIKLYDEYMDLIHSVACKNKLNTK